MEPFITIYIGCMIFISIASLKVYFTPLDI